MLCANTFFLHLFPYASEADEDETRPLCDFLVVVKHLPQD
jgi:hypothetical protein